MKGQTIQDINFDIRLENGELLEVKSASKKLVGTKMTPGDIKNALKGIVELGLGHTPFKNKDWVEAIMMIKRMQHKATGNGSVERQNIA